MCVVLHLSRFTPRFIKCNLFNCFCCIFFFFYSLRCEVDEVIQNVNYDIMISFGFQCDNFLSNGVMGVGSGEQHLCHAVFHCHGGEQDNIKECSSNPPPLSLPKSMQCKGWWVLKSSPHKEQPCLQRQQWSCSSRRELPVPRCSARDGFR